ncbi:hypothetical protein [Puia dinghuensis]|uniref:Glycosyl hydrolase family 32 N-terminal domain-containing protein n=1 Tax=Puia dinghuensis TaxID=1792502 RepID=A0A8J2UFB1_9BACT|nr:hypothetical protein [Puia dinghuensis]GGB08596.1 hypothetical protein GCM10011511_35100 [Puia dinghuensis]
MALSWQKKGLIYAPDGSLEWSRTHAQVPVADVIDEHHLRIYYSTRGTDNRSNTSYIEVDAGDPREITFINPAPILPLGRLGTFDEDGIMPSSIVTVGDRKYLYYIGWSQRKNVPYQNSIGLAISEDGGRTFRKYSEGPVIGVSHIDPFFTGTIFVLKEAGLFRAYYLSCVEWRLVNDRPESLYVLKYATSQDGIDWLRNNQIAIPLKDDQEGGLVSAAVIKAEGRYRMWFGYRNYFDFRSNPENAYNIGYAESPDGISWLRKDDKSGIERSEEGWDSQMISYPYVIEVKGKNFLFYNGNGFGRTGFGYAILNSNS